MQRVKKFVYMNRSLLSGGDGMGFMLASVRLVTDLVRTSAVNNTMIIIVGFMTLTVAVRLFRRGS